MPSSSDRSLRRARPRRFQGREAFYAFASPERAALPVRFDEVRNVVVHEATDPEVIVAEYELVGTVTTTGRSAAASFVVVLRVHDGRIVLWREYQNVLVIAEALDQLPALRLHLSSRASPQVRALGGASWSPQDQHVSRARSTHENIPADQRGC
jgi:ketosteroid isomerase-like protein